VTLTKCKVKLDISERMRMGSSASKKQSEVNDDSCPVIMAVEARKPPDVRNPQTRYVINGSIKLYCISLIRTDYSTKADFSKQHFK
jgi:hypothetical protein